jgi:hypothetical protein
MGTNVAASWQKAAKLLQDCSTRQPNSAEAQTAVQSVHDLISKLMDLPTPPKAVWKKLVQQLQVCCALNMHFGAAPVVTAPRSACKASAFVTDSRE